MKIKGLLLSLIILGIMIMGCGNSEEEVTFTNTDVTKWKIIEEDQEVLLGSYEITAYCPCEICCGPKNPENYGRTSSQVIAVEGITIATDNSIIPIGSKIKIGDTIYTAQDSGSAIKEKKIDIYLDSHEDAKAFGVQIMDVYLYIEGGTRWGIK